MPKTEIASAIVHKVPNDLRTSLLSNHVLLEKWNNLTPIARNEWVCWLTSVKKLETRQDHLRRLSKDISEGKKRPCCWPGCPHRDK